MMLNLPEIKEPWGNRGKRKEEKGFNVLVELGEVKKNNFKEYKLKEY